MKIKILPFAALIALAASSCKQESTETKKTDSTTVVADSAKKVDEYKVDLDSSQVKWHGEVMGGVHFHEGTVKLTEASLGLSGDQIASGAFTIDLKSVKPSDKNYSGKGKTADDLVKHLSSKDFFLVDSFPTATFVVKSADANTVIGDLTVRGVTNEEKVTDVVVTKSDAGLTATGKLVFNRQKYGVAYKSNIKDVVLSDDIVLDIILKAKK